MAATTVGTFGVGRGSVCTRQSRLLLSVVGGFVPCNGVGAVQGGEGGGGGLLGSNVVHDVRQGFELLVL